MSARYRFANIHPLRVKYTEQVSSSEYHLEEEGRLKGMLPTAYEDIIVWHRCYLPQHTLVELTKTERILTAMIQVREIGRAHV